MVAGTSIETRSAGGFGVADYVVFALLLCSNALVGLFYAFKDRRDKKQTTREYLLGGRNQNVVPVALSLAVTFLSANTMIGVPADLYYSHTMYIYTALALVLSTVLASWIFIPFFYRLGYTTVFQYLEERFSPQVRALVACFTVCQTLIYMAFVLYAPALALSAVTGIGFDGCVIGMGLVVTFYTALGGMKTVLWTDTIQSVTMLAGLLAVFIQGIRVVGGWTKVWDIAEERGRVVLDDFSFQPNVRHSFFSVVIGGGIHWTAIYGVSQSQVQRCLATSSVSQARISVLLNMPVIVLMLVLSCLNGVVMFAFYADCDPVKFGVVGKKDQILPLFMLDILGHVEGFPGLFVSSVFAGSLSSLSSGLNAIAATVYEESRRAFNLKLSETRALILTKFIAMLSGLVSVGLAFMVSELGTIAQAVQSVYGLINGPLFGVFILGMFFPWSNSKGAFTGFLASFTFMGWIGIGAYVNKIRTSIPSPTMTAGCNWPNGTEPVPPANTSYTTPATMEYEGVDIIYTLSYLYYTVVGAIMAVVIGLVVSFITGFTQPTKLDPKHVMSMFYLMKPPVEGGQTTTNKTKNGKSRSKTNGVGDVRFESKSGLDGYSGMAETSIRIGNNRGV